MSMTSADDAVWVEKIMTFPAPEKSMSMWEMLVQRAHQQPFLLVASVIFFCAIVHTFFSVPISKAAHHCKNHFLSTTLHFLGEIEAIFGIWVVVLLAAMTSMHGFSAVTNYMNHLHFTEPMFVFVIMAIAATRPVIRFADECLGCIAKLLGNSVAAWWFTILAIAPLLGSFITEPAAMTIAALLLAKKFYVHKPSSSLCYATLGLLFVNISVGGVLTHFAAPPVIMVASKWYLSTSDMFFCFGDKAICAIVFSTLLYFFLFRKEFSRLQANAKDVDHDGTPDWLERKDSIPIAVTLMHLLAMAWTVFTLHTPALFIGGFLFFLAFKMATHDHQNPIAIRSPLMVAFFLAALVVHGGLQGWWLAPILASLSKIPLFIGATILTGFNDNAAITYLASQVEGLSATLKYSVLAGAVTGGGLSVIANAPNPAGQSILSKFFGDGISPLKLLLAALIPTIIVALAFLLFPNSGLEEIFAK